METTLKELFPSEWEESQPAKISDLILADYESLNTKSKLLRAQVIEAIHGFERQPVLTPADARAMLEKHHLPKYKGKWVVVAVNSKREKIYQKTENGGMRLLSVIKEYIPKAITAHNEVPLPKNGKYILIYNGSVDVLLDTKALERFKDLNSKKNVLDIIVWEERETTATFWSVKAGTGAIGNSYKDFPDIALLNEWRSALDGSI